MRHLFNLNFYRGGSLNRVLIYTTSFGGQPMDPADGQVRALSFPYKSGSNTLTQERLKIWLTRDGHRKGTFRAAR